MSIAQALAAWVASSVVMSLAIGRVLWYCGTRHEEEQRRRNKIIMDELAMVRNATHDLEVMELYHAEEICDIRNSVAKLYQRKEGERYERWN
jgi:hypothetical protein